MLVTAKKAAGLRPIKSLQLAAGLRPVKCLQLAAGLRPVKSITNLPNYRVLAYATAGKKLQYAGDLRLEKHGEIGRIRSKLVEIWTIANCKLQSNC
jgi:hypothetical protein